MKKIVILCVLFLWSDVVFAQTHTWFTTLATQFGTLVATTIPVLIALAFLVFVWGLVVFISASGNDSAKEEGRRKMIWGIIALFVIVSIWGILAIIRTITGTTGNVQGLPTPWITAGG